MLEYFVRRYTDEAKRILKKESLDAKLSFSIRLYYYGCVGMTREWLLHDDITSAKTIVEMMFDSMPLDLSEIFFGS